MDYDMRGLGFTAGDVVVITGGASGIGRATAHLASRSGLKVWIWDMNPEALADAVNELNEAGGDAHGTVCDVTDVAAVGRAWAEADLVGPPRYLVNNAGPAHNTELSYLDGLLSGAGSMVTVTEEWLSRFGDVAEATTFTSSIAAVRGGTKWYPVAKAAIATYTRTVASRFGGRPRANAVAPGLTVTPRTQPWIEAGTVSYERIPLQRPGQAEEIATAICFLLSPAASYINGVYLPVDGGALVV